jgi:hypothetical protein
MSFSDEFLRGVVSIFKLTSPPLYRYPYRNSIEAFRSDWKHIGGDIDAAFQSFEGGQEGAQNE